nr:hypothetical protein [uncultured Campylobacter sp.]
MQVFRVLLALCFGVVFSYSKVCEDYQYKLQEYEFQQISIFKATHKNAMDDEMWNIAAKECEENNSTAIPACIYLYKNVLKQNFENKNISKINLFYVLDTIAGFYIAEAKKQENTKKNFINYKIVAIAEDTEKAAKALYDGGYFTKEQYKTQSDLRDAILMVYTISACPSKYDASKTQPFIPDDKINDACLCLLKQHLLIKDEDYLTATKISELLCKKYKDDASCLIAGIAYKEGLGVRFDILKAKEYFGLACDYGNQDGCSKYKALSY